MGRGSCDVGTRAHVVGLGCQPGGSTFACKQCAWLMLCSLVCLFRVSGSEFRDAVPGVGLRAPANERR